MTEDQKIKAAEIAKELRESCIPVSSGELAPKLFRSTKDFKTYVRTYLLGGPSIWDPTGEINKVEVWFEVKQPALGFLMLGHDEEEL